MRGRWPQGLEYIDKLDGSPQTKERFRIILQTLTGEMRMLEACDQMQIGETRFHQLRQVGLQAALTAMEPRPGGRPSRGTTAEEQTIRALQARVAELEHALHRAQVREEIALVLPRVQRTAGDDDPAGYVTKTIDANNHTVLTSFDPAGLATKVVDGDGFTTLSSYDADNRLTQVVDGDGHTRSTGYDKNDNVTLTTDGAGVTAQTAFDANNNVTRTVVHGYTTTFQLDKDNNQTASVDGDGHTTAQAFDPADQLTKVTDPDTNVTSYGLEAGTAWCCGRPAKCLASNVVVGRCRMVGKL